MGREIWIVTEYDQKGLTNLTRELMGIGKTLTLGRGEKLCAVLLGNDDDELVDELASFRAERIYLAGDKKFKHYNPELHLNLFEKLIKENNPQLVIFGMTCNGRELAARLAARLRTFFVPSCVSVKPVERDCFELTRLRHAGLVQELARRRREREHGSDAREQDEQQHRLLARGRGLVRVVAQGLEDR
ncbi:MAG: hypothetical protein K6U74_05400 [Firmicutes bacterium]|nr:hypothetical protein [Bacillota bacterium]